MHIASDALLMVRILTILSLNACSFRIKTPGSELNGFVAKNPLRRDDLSLVLNKTSCSSNAKFKMWRFSEIFGINVKTTFPYCLFNVM